MKRVFRSFLMTSICLSMAGGCLLLDPFPALKDEPSTNDGSPPSVTSSDGGQDACTGADVARDPNHCGSCGRRCATGFACSEGRCGDEVVSMAAGANHTCAVLRRGDVFCWGANDTSQTGAAPTDAGVAEPQLVPRDEQNASITAASLALGREHTCALRPDGVMRCWGSRLYGALSDNRTSPDGGALSVARPQLPYQSTSTIVGSPVLTYASLAQGPFARHGCATEADGGRVYCWGANDKDQLGPIPAAPILTAVDCPEMTDGCRGIPARVGELEDIAQVAVGWSHTCARDRSGAVKCWGSSLLGQLGTGALPSFCVPLGSCDAGTPPFAADVEGASFIAAGNAATCAVLADKTVWCWGVNTTDVLGHSRLDETKGTKCCRFDWVCYSYCNPKPTRVDGVAGAISVGVGDGHACALLEDRTVRCWGANDKGQLGTGDATPPASPRAVVGLANVAGIAVGGAHTCAWTTNGTAFCWGLGAQGQLGSAISDGNAHAPRPVSIVR